MSDTGKIKDDWRKKPDKVCMIFAEWALKVPRKYISCNYSAFLSLIDQSDLGIKKSTIGTIHLSLHRHVQHGELGHKNE